MTLRERGLSPATSTTLAQREVEQSLLRFLRHHHPEVDALWSAYHGIDPGEAGDGDDGETFGACLHRELHKQYLQRSLLCLGEHTQGFYSAQPWLVYWALQAADVLGITEELYEHVSPHALGEFILACLQEVDTAGGSGSNHGENNKNGNDADKNMANTSSNAGRSLSEGVQSLERAASPPFNGPLDVTAIDDGKRVAGFAGGRLAQIPHLAASYAAVCSLCILARPFYLESVPRAAIKRWILMLRCDDGSFRMHLGGEADIRASYCVAVMVVLLQLDDVSAYPDGRDDAVLTAQTAAFVASCQTREGGFSCGQHASEAHAAYTYCGLAALLLMKQPRLCNYAALRRWLAARQFTFEGGFNGRTNKLVDSCYSHWVGASHILMQVGEAYVQLLEEAATPQCLTARETLLLDHAQLLDASCVRPTNNDLWFEAEEAYRQRVARVEKCIHASSSSSSSSRASFLDEEVGDFLFNQRRLLLYVLSCCQDCEKGGLMDKPHHPNDAYHTCYALSGMSSAQNLQYLPRGPSVDDTFMYAAALRHGYAPAEQHSYGVVLVANDAKERRYQSPERLRPTNPIFNIHRSRVLFALRVWGVKSFLC